MNSLNLAFFHYKKKIISPPILIAGISFILIVLINNIMISLLTNYSEFSSATDILNPIFFIFGVFIFTLFIGFITFLSFKNDMIKWYIKLEQQTISKVYKIFLIRILVFCLIFLTYFLIMIILSEFSYLFANFEQYVISQLFRIKYAFYLILAIFLFSIFLLINLFVKEVYDFIFISLIAIMLAVMPFIGSAINVGSSNKSKKLNEFKSNYIIFIESLKYGQKFYNEFKDDSAVNFIFEESTEEFLTIVQNNIDEIYKDTFDQRIVNFDELFAGNASWSKNENKIREMFYGGQVYSSFSTEEVQVEEGKSIFEGTQIWKIFEDIETAILRSDFMNRDENYYREVMTPFFNPDITSENWNAKDYNWMDISEVLNYLIKELPQYTHLFNFISDNYVYYNIFNANFEIGSPFLKRGLFYYWDLTVDNDYIENKPSSDWYAEISKKVPEVTIINWIILNSYRSVKVIDTSVFSSFAEFSEFNDIIDILDSFKKNSLVKNSSNIPMTLFMMYQSNSGKYSLSNVFNSKRSLFKTLPNEILTFDENVKNEIIKSFTNYLASNDRNNSDLIISEVSYEELDFEIKKSFSDIGAYFSFFIIGSLLTYLNYFIFKRKMLMLN